MAFAALLLIVLAAFVHAGWNLLAKRAASVGPIFVLAYTAVALVAYAPWALYLLAQGEAAGWTRTEAGVLALSGLIHVAYNLCLQRGYQAADLSVVYPIARGVGPTLSTLGAFLLLGETPTGRGLAGLALVVVGIGLIATQGDLAGFRRPAGRAGVRWGVATGALIACYTVVDAYAVKTLGIAPVVVDWIANLTRCLLLAPLALARPCRAAGAMRGAWLLALGVGLLSPLSYILVLAALASGAPLSLAAPMREMSMMLGALMGMAILRETVGPWRLAGCATLIAGVILLSGA